LRWCAFLPLSSLSFLRDSFLSAQVLTLDGCGPGIKRLENGETVELVFTPPSYHDAKGKGKAVPMTCDSSDYDDDDDGNPTGFIVRQGSDEEDEDGTTERSDGSEAEPEDEVDEVDVKSEKDDDEE
jgi:hypothetical protein